MTDTVETKQSPIWIKLWPVYLIAAVMIGAWQMGLFQYLSLDTLRDQQEVLQSFVSENLFLAVAIFILIYAAATLFMICLLYTSPSPRDRTRSRMPSSA